MRIVCLVAALLAFSFSIGAQDSTGVIDGMVLDDAGSPVPAAGVSLLSNTGRVLRTLVADDTGAFLFDALPAGRFTVNAAKVGYAPRSYGQTSANAGDVVIALAPNGRFRARVRLPRVGAISGMVVDEDGQPVSVAVRATRYTMRDGLRALDDHPIDIDADRQGRYRFTGLVPGDYLVSALGPDGELRRMTPEFVQRAMQAVQQPAQALPPSDAGRESTVSYVTVYYPGVVSRARATAVTVAPGDERTNINVQLQVVPAIRLEGTVTLQDGKPAAYANVSLSSADDGIVWSYGQTTSAGYFHLAPVPLGPYVLSAASTTVDVSLTDPLNVNIAVRVETTPVSLTGRAIFDGTAPRPDCRRTPCRPVLVPRSGQSGQSGGRPSSGTISAVMDAAGPIVFNAVPPGSYSIALGMPIAGWTMASAEIDGHDAMDNAVEVGSRTAVSGLVVTFTDRQTEFSGSTPVGGTAPPADAVSVVVFPTDRRLWVPGGRRIRVVRPDTGGQYRVAGLPPGDYLVAVVTNFDAEADLDATRLAALQASASPVTIRRPDSR